MSSKKTAVRKSPSRSITRSELELVPQKIAPLVLKIRRENVLLDSDLAELYGVETKSLNRAVKRNAKRFPKDFMFQLTEQEWNNLKCQFGTSSHGGRRTPPYVFTEQGVSMLSSVLNSDRAIQINIAIMRTFVQLRNLMTTNKMLEEKIERLEQKYDGQFREVFYIIGKILRNEQTDV
jgi:hypothetical protein